MPHYNPDEEVFASNAHFLAPSGSALKKSPSRQVAPSARRSTVSLRGSSSLALETEGDSAINVPQHSLAHELAAALMPEPSAGSKLLAEEFGIEFDEGAEGIDEVPNPHGEPNGMGIHVVDDGTPSIASELSPAENVVPFGDVPPEDEIQSELLNDPEFDPVFSSPSASKKKVHAHKMVQDPMELLAQDLKSTEDFVEYLKKVDLDPSSSGSHQQSLEKLASDIIRRINVSVRDREGHVRELQEYDRELRKIAGEVGGEDILGQLEELAPMEDLSDRPIRVEPSRITSSKNLDMVEEEPRSPNQTVDWELDPDRRLGDDEDMTEPATSPLKETFTTLPLVIGPPTPATTVTHLTQLRSATTSLVASLTIISEQAQVNGAGTSEAGRKIRALKNKLGGWRTDWDSAERSRLKIERWETGLTDGEEPTNTTPSARPMTRRIDGRKIVEEHLRAFELALAEAVQKTQAIMAR